MHHADPIGHRNFCRAGHGGHTGPGGGRLCLRRHVARFEIFGQSLIAPRSPGELALTFDDGPNPAWTPRLLDTLAARDVRATFFLVGSYAEASPRWSAASTPRGT